MNTTNSIAHLASTLNISANLTFDDIVNVVVSRHEDALVARRTELQQRAKANTNEGKNLKMAMRDDVLAKFQSEFPAQVQAGGAMMHNQVTINDEPGSNFLVTKMWPGQLSISLIMGSTQVLFTDYHASSVKQAATTTSYLGGMVDNELFAQYMDNIKVGEELKQQLMQINAELQGIDRKTRQVKALLAERKLAENGLHDLLALPEIAQILQLPSN